MALKCFSDTAYSRLHLELSQNFTVIRDCYINNNQPWAERYLQEIGVEDPISFVLDPYCSLPTLKLPRGATPAKRVEYDIDNSISFHIALRDVISPAMAANGKLWAYLCNEPYYEYVSKRWPVTTTTSEYTINKRLIGSGSGARKLYRNGIARLWWFAEMTYDKTNTTDPYGLTKVLLRRQDDAENSFGRDLLLNKKLLHTLLRVLKDENPKDYGRNVFRPMMVDINNVGGVSILDALPDEKLENLIRRKLNEHKNKT